MELPLMGNSAMLLVKITPGIQWREQLSGPPLQ
jgi:hypothetical protein